MSLKIGSTRKKITPAVGTHLAGYGKNVVSNGVADDLFISGLSFDDGKNKAILLSYDLLGLDAEIVGEIRGKCAQTTGLEPSEIVLTCTHTHSGPHTRRNMISEWDTDYVKRLIEWSVESVEEIFTETREVTAHHYSGKCYENVNRRIVFPDNSCRMLSELKHHTPLADGITDPELGILYFRAIDDEHEVLATLVNYAAHPLSSQTGGDSSLKITSDFPGHLRNYVERELGGICVYTSGACGDLHPKGYCEGLARAEEMGRNIAKLVTKHFFDTKNNRDMFEITNPEIETGSFRFDAQLRVGSEEKLKLYGDMQTIPLELQLLTIGDVCLVGMPGELLAEPGLEVKWHSPFKKTFILYNSTGYISYIPHANAYAQGGYESETALIEPGESFKLVAETIKAMNALHQNSSLK